MCAIKGIFLLKQHRLGSREEQLIDPDFELFEAESRNPSFHQRAERKAQQIEIRSAPGTITRARRGYWGATP